MDKEEEVKPTAFMVYRPDRDNPRKQKAIQIPQHRWEDEWLTWWYRRGSQMGSTREGM